MKSKPMDEQMERLTPTALRGLIWAEQADLRPREREFAQAATDADSLVRWALAPAEAAGIGKDRKALRRFGRAAALADSDAALCAQILNWERQAVPAWLGIRSALREAGLRPWGFVVENWGTLALCAAALGTLALCKELFGEGAAWGGFALGFGVSATLLFLMDFALLAIGPMAERRRKALARWILEGQSLEELEAAAEEECFGERPRRAAGKRKAASGGAFDAARKALSRDGGEAEAPEASAWKRFELLCSRIGEGVEPSEGAYLSSTEEAQLDAGVSAGARKGAGLRI